ncbi:MAG: histidine triad nucleotide-binding protein [Candidatus Omnitrophica bacterium]|nr:histidine triad nucleotide-binding protein [Candidatus Omnitrophota bacterium]
MDKNCLFCKIIKGEIKAKIAYENEKVFAFYDINPQAPTHVLIIPKLHISGAPEIDDNNRTVVSDLIIAANEIARQSGIDKTGYRLVLNCGPDAGQAVFHLHLHLLGGRKLNWPPG